MRLFDGLAGRNLRFGDPLGPAVVDNASRNLVLIDCDGLIDEFARPLVEQVAANVSPLFAATNLSNSFCLDSRALIS